MSSESQSSTANGQPEPDPSSTDFGQLAGLVHAFIGMMHAGGIARMDVEHAGLKLSLRAHEALPMPGGPVPTMARPQAGVQVTVDGIGTEDDTSGDHIVRAPMIGTFYVASAPNEPAFVQQGDVVEEGQTIGIIEAMKIMNEIAADRAGTVVEVVALNAQTVEYGSPLIRLAPAGDA